MALNFPDNPTNGQVFVGPDGTTWEWDGVKWKGGVGGTAYLPLTGGTLTGPLILSGDPSAPLGASTKQYVDTKTGQYLPLSGGTLSGGITTPAVTSNVLSGPGGLAPPVAVASPPAGDNSLDLATTAWVQAMLLGRQNRNSLINGNFLVDQRNNFVSITPINQQFVADRWRATLNQTGKFTTAAAIIASGQAPSYRNLLMTSLSAYTSLATDMLCVGQPVEYQNIAHFGWGTANARPVTLSFWAAASVAGLYSGSIINYAGTRSYPFTFNIATANTWIFFSITIPGDTAGTWSVANNAGAMLVIFDLGSGANYRATAGTWAAGNYLGATGAALFVATNAATFQITNVQLEMGQQATAFDWHTVGEELNLCQRYYQTINVVLQALVANTSNFGGAVSYINIPTPMRAAPTATFTQGGTNGWVGTISVAGSSPGLVTAQSSTTQTTAGAYMAGSVTLASEL